MANNKNVTTINSTILLNKIGELSDRLKIISQSGIAGQTNQELIIAANNLLGTFFTQMSQPIFNPETLLRDTKPDVVDYNTNLSNILSDLKILFLELANIANLEIANFNFMVSDSNRLMGRMKSVYSKLGDYILFSQDPNKDSIYFTDSFSNLDRVDFNSKLITSVQANIDQNQGVATLPLQNQTFTPLTLTIPPVINSNSNGTTGNNFEVNHALHNNIVDVLDDNPDTWFEYEKVLTNGDIQTEPLVLDITLNLGSSQIINYIRINPNNFGTQTSIDIETIETSSDGKNFSSIKDDIPLAGFQGDNDTDLFTIAPASSKFAGQALYSFTPRYAKFVHLTFKQTTPYSIQDGSSTIRERFAIGIRDIEIAAIPYVSKGEVISTSYSLDVPARKVAVISNQFPDFDFSLVEVDHYVSPDDGLTWTQIHPDNIATDNITIPAIINYNSLDTNAIVTTSPANTLRYKAVLKRNDNNFSNPANFQTINTEPTSELIPVPSGTPFNLQLNGKPIKATIKLMDPTFGSRGVDNTRYTLGKGTNGPQSFITPFTQIKKDKSKYFDGAVYQIQDVDPEVVRVNGEIWVRGNLTLATSGDKVYEMNYFTGEVRFGNSIQGLAPSQGADIDLMFRPENLYVLGGTDHIATLQYQTSNDKKSMTITQYGASTVTSEVIAKQALSTTLGHKNLDRFSIPTFSNTSVFHTERGFIDGFSEFIASGDYSVDYENGVVYTKVQTDAFDDITINYRYIPTKDLVDTDWDFVDGSNYTQISINDNTFTSLPAGPELLPVGAKYSVLKQSSIVQNSLVFQGPSVANFFLKEVPFVDGTSELITAQTTTEPIPDFTHSGTNRYQIRLKLSPSVNLKVSFSNTLVFAHEVTSSLSVVTPGQYFIDRAVNQVVFIGIANLGTITYYYDDGMKNSNGLYSINYKNGEVYTSNAISDGIIVTYNYSHYVAKYNIARSIDATDFTYDDSQNLVTVKEREILKRQNISKKDTTQSNFYQVLYDTVTDNTDQLKALAPYFTPILRDYALKVITESSLLF